MILLPVIERELRAAARRPFTYHLRVLGVVALLVALALFALRGNLGPGAGAELFRYLHEALFFAIWGLVPLLCIDVLSRERREGTLALLFLTPLKARDIVYAKTFAQALRSFTLWLAVLPVLAVAFLAGGVSWMEAAMSALVNFSSACLALAAGLAASALTRVWARALALGMVLAAVFLFFFLSLFPRVQDSVMRACRGRPPAELISPWSVSEGFALAVNADGIWQDLLATGGSGGPILRGMYAPWGGPGGSVVMVRTGLPGMPSGYVRWMPLPAAPKKAAAAVALCGFGVVALLSLLFFLLVVRFAAWKIRRSWQDHPLSERAARVRRILCQPVVFQSALRRWLNWQLGRNPIGWLEQRSWTGRLIVWSWLAVVVCIYSSLFSNMAVYHHSFHIFQTVLALLLAMGLALSAAGSFRRERETGVMELLLVAPLREWQIIGGRVRGLWIQFLPSIVLLCSVWLYGMTFQTEGDELTFILFYACAFATVPVVGLYFSLATPHFIVAFLATLIVQVIMPQILAELTIYAFDAGSASGEDDSGLVWLVASVSLQVLTSLILGWRLHCNLKQRAFAFDRREP